MASESHWVEIDLLRAGEPTTKGLARLASDYRIVVSRSTDRQQFCLPVSLRQALPIIGIPLRDKDPDVPLDLGAVLREELSVQSEILAIDGVTLWDFDYIDLGRIRLPSNTVPVTIKSLIFSEDPRLPHGQTHLGHGPHESHYHEHR